MNRFSNFLLLLVIFGFCLSACKKEAKPQQVSAPFLGKWYVRLSKMNTFSNGILVNSSTLNENDVIDTNAYCKFDADGTGYSETDLLAEYYGNKAFDKFSYQVSDSTMIFSAYNGLFGRDTCTFFVHKPDTLIMKANFASYNNGDDQIKEITEVTLTK